MTRGVGRRLRRLRKDRDMKQPDVAERIGKSVAYVSMVENDHIDPDTEMVRKFANALGVPASSILEDTDELGAAVYSGASIHFSLPGTLSEKDKRRIEELIRELGTASPDDREMIYRLVDKIFSRP